MAHLLTCLRRHPTHVGLIRRVWAVARRYPTSVVLRRKVRDIARSARRRLTWTTGNATDNAPAIVRFGDFRRLEPLFAPEGQSATMVAMHADRVLQKYSRHVHGEILRLGLAGQPITTTAPLATERFNSIVCNLLLQQPYEFDRAI